MRNIIANIMSLRQYLNEIFFISEIKCQICCCNKLYKHGCYYRKAERQKIAIKRFKCTNCGHTCSILPECIPPRRWYLWEIQQAVLLMVLNGDSYRTIAKKTHPVSSTIARWIKHLKKRTVVYMDHLKFLYPKLNRLTDFKRFWRRCLEFFPLSKIMLNLNNAGIIVP
jgi:transposase-like protein